MSAFAPFTEVQMQMMAMSKARGYSWQMMATCFEMPLDVVERVAWTHGKVWNRMLTKAERLVAREAIAEAVGCLRRDITEAEPHVRPTIVNSLTRLLKQQQEFAPRRRPRPKPTPPIAAPVVPEPVLIVPVAPSVNVAAPLPATPMHETSATPMHETSARATIVASLVGFLVLVCTLLLGCCNRAHQAPEFADKRAHEPMIALRTSVSEGANVAAVATPRIVQSPPPWERERAGPCRDGT